MKPGPEPQFTERVKIGLTPVQLAWVDDQPEGNRSAVIRRLIDNAIETTKETTDEKTAA